jgi:hypothetical protein
MAVERDEELGRDGEVSGRGVAPRKTEFPLVFQINQALMPFQQHEDPQKGFDTGLYKAIKAKIDKDPEAKQRMLEQYGNGESAADVQLLAVLGQVTGDFEAKRQAVFVAERAFQIQKTRTKKKYVFSQEERAEDQLQSPYRDQNLHKPLQDAQMRQLYDLARLAPMLQVQEKSFRRDYHEQAHQRPRIIPITAARR